MTHNKRKKNSRQRGSFTHGWGEKKKHRGAGHRGGRGNAGSGKKGDAKKPSFWKNPNYFGKQGFVSLNRTKVSTINLSMIEQQKENFLNTDYGSKAGDLIKIDLTSLGFTKILGAGNIVSKFEITIQTASKKAISKIESAGGKVIGLDKAEPSTQQKKKEEKPAEKKSEVKKEE